MSAAADHSQGAQAPVIEEIRRAVAFAVWLGRTSNHPLARHIASQLADLAQDVHRRSEMPVASQQLWALISFP
jgi:hypothetical protein